MARRFWTSDWHLGHPAIIEYCKRPFKDVHHMNERLIGEANMRAKAEDTVVHVGDFVTKGVAKGVEGLRLKAVDYLKRLDAAYVLIEGNHDKQNKTKTVGRYMFTDIGPQHAFVSHYPTTAEHMPPSLLAYARASADFAIVGHVHEKWLYQWDGHGLLNVNVGVDQHNYRPISDDEILTLVNKIKRQLI